MVKPRKSQDLGWWVDSHWCLKLINSGFARALAPYIQNLDFLAPRTSHQKEISYMYGSVSESFTSIWSQGSFELNLNTYSHQPLKLQCSEYHVKKCLKKKLGGLMGRRDQKCITGLIVYIAHTTKIYIIYFTTSIYGRSGSMLGGRGPKMNFRICDVYN